MFEIVLSIHRHIRRPLKWRKKKRFAKNRDWTQIGQRRLSTSPQLTCFCSGCDYEHGDDGVHEL
jgi:hypothetical protein